MKIAFFTLPHVGGAIGSEDQAGLFVVEELRAMGHDVTVFFEHESVLAQGQHFDMAISNGALAAMPCWPAVYWHFNERTCLEAAPYLSGDLGFTHLATAVPSGYWLDEQVARVRECGMQLIHLPLAASCQLAPNTSFSCAPCAEVAYVGNWNPAYKQDAPEYWLNPISEEFGDRFVIFGGSKWSQHPTLSSHWKGAMPAELWPYAHRLAPKWFAFRSPEQMRLGMTPDRLFWLSMAGVSHVVSDNPRDKAFQDLVDWAKNPGEAVEYLKRPRAFCGTSGTDKMMRLHSYRTRMKTLVDWCHSTGKDD